MNIPNLGDFFNALTTEGAKVFQVKKRRKREGQIFLETNELDVSRIFSLEDCEPFAPITTETEWANATLEMATDECADAIISAFAAAYGDRPQLRQEVWSGLTPENKAKMIRFRQLVEGVAA